MDDPTASAPPAATAEAAAPRRRWPWLLALLVLLGGAGGGWWYVSGGAMRSEPLAALRAELERLNHAQEQLRARLDTVRARLDDGDKVDQSVREQLLGLGERTRLLEDAVANLADKRLSAHDTLALDEAELLLTLGRERFALAHDVAAALAAYRLADTALSEVEDAAFSTVRQSIRAEVAALTALATPDPATLAARLAALRERVPALPPVRAPAPAPESETPSRWARLLGALVRVQRDDAAHAALAAADVQLARELLLLDLAEARAALRTHDGAAWRDALAAARVELASGFDPAAAEVQAARAEVDALAGIELAPAAPAVLGSALTELRNLRATHALRRPQAAPKSAANDADKPR